MKKNWKELMVGAFGSLLLYLIVVVEVDPLAMIMVLTSIFIASVLYNVFHGRGMIGAAGVAKMPELLSFDEIGGQEIAKRELMEALDFLVHGDDLSRYGIRPLKGILLAGPPGTGKTLLAKAAAHYTDSVFLYAAGSDFVEMYVGVGARRVRGLFKEARQLTIKQKKKNAIIFIDEIDVLGGKRDSTTHAKEADQTLNQLLTEMDGLFSQDLPRIFMIAATNRKDMLDDALLRPGRFDRQIQIDLPDKQGRLQILGIHALNKPLSVDVILDLIADQTFGFSGAQLESLMNEAAVYAFREQKELIEQCHLTQAIDKVLLGETSDRRTNEEERRRIAIHELGHAIAAETFRPGSVNQVSLSPRGMTMGYVRQNPKENTNVYSKSDLEEQIKISLAGAAAEEIFYGERSTGSRQDFDHALQIVETMIRSGLTRLGIVKMEMLTHEAAMTECQNILNDLMEQTRSCLDERRNCVESLLPILLQEEILTSSALQHAISESKKGTCTNGVA
nr:AAA family ATPase [Paenibacillus sp. V4I7]